MASKEVPETESMATGGEFGDSWIFDFKEQPATQKLPAGESDDPHALRETLIYETDDTARTLSVPLKSQKKRSRLIAVLGTAAVILGSAAFFVIRSSFNLNDTYYITVDYRQDLKQMIAAGEYSSVHSDINSSSFSIEKRNDRVEFKVTLLHVGELIKTDYILDKITLKNWQPAKIEHLLALGTQHPEMQKKYPIAALGSVLEKDFLSVIPVLNSQYQNRRLDLVSTLGRWPEDYRFLVIEPN